MSEQLNEVGISLFCCTYFLKLNTIELTIFTTKKMYLTAEMRSQIRDGHVWSAPKSSKTNYINYSLCTTY